MKPSIYGRRKVKRPLSPDERLFLSVIILATIVAFFLVLSGCATTSTATITPPPPIYELTLTGTIDGSAFQGIGVGSNASSHAMTIQSAIPVNYFTLQTCHRSVQFSDVIKVPWYDWAGDSKSFSFVYSEAPTIEDSGDCPLRFCAYSNTVGSPPVACAVVDFKNTKYSLPAENICNGADGQTSGTAICHSMVGLIERVRFSSSVVIAPQEIDPTGKTAPYSIPGQCQGTFLDDAQTLFQYAVPANECTAIFMQKASPHLRAKLTVIPYTTAIYPGT